MALIIDFRFLLLLQIFVGLDKLFSRAEDHRQSHAFKRFACKENSRMVPETNPVKGKEPFLIETLRVRKRSECGLRCVKHNGCDSYNVQKKATASNGELKCELLNIGETSAGTKYLKESNEYFHYTSVVCIYVVYTLFSF